MRKGVMMAAIVLLSVLCMNGCNNDDKKSNENSTVKTEGNNVDQTDNKKDINLKYPEIKDVIFPELYSADITFAKGMAYNYVDFIVYSTKELDTDKVYFSCETDLPYECSITGELDPVKPSSMGYALLCAYNDIEVGKNQISDKMTVEEYEDVVNSGAIKNLYAYVATLTIDVDKCENIKNKEISKLLIVYEDEKYEYSIGKIKFSDDIIVDNYNYDESIEWQYGTDYQPMKNVGSISTDIDYILSTTNKELTIKKLELDNVDWTVDKLIVHIENENGVIETEYDGNEIIIPQNSNVNFEIKFSENHPELLGSSYSPLLKVDYQIDGKGYDFNYLFYVTNVESAYETYAFLIDGIDIYNLYQKNIVE